MCPKTTYRMIRAVKVNAIITQIRFNATNFFNALTQLAIDSDNEVFLSLPT